MPDMAKAWVLLLTGAALVLMTGGALAFKPNPKRTARTTALLLVFGVLLAGLGTFGLDFLPRYTGFVQGWQALDDLIKDPEKAAAGFVDKVADGKVPPAVGAAGLAMLASEPVEGVEERVRTAAARAPQGSDRRHILEAAMKNLEGRRNEAEQLVAKRVDPAQAATFSPGTLQRMRARIETMPEAEKTRMGITDNDVRTFRKLAPP